MAVIDSLINAGAALAGAAGEALTGIEERLVKASDEDNSRGPGGAQPDSAKNAPFPTQASEMDPQSLFFDPYAIIEQLGYRDKPSQVTYRTLKSMVYQAHVIGAVIQTRVSQVAAFSKPSHDRFSMGFRVRPREQEKKETTPAEKKWIEQAETFITRTGITDNPRGRDNFKTFLKKFSWDSLVYDQSCMEVVENRKGVPCEFYAVDGSTIRLADTASTYMNEALDEEIRYVQIYDGVIINEYTQNQMCFGTRNPRTDIKLYGYGVSELEMMIRAVTAFLWGWEYNQNAFSQGSVHKGLLNFKGAIPDRQLRQFRRHWYGLLSSVSNSWKTPILNAEDVQWIPMHSTNRDMEYNAWMDFLIKVLCSFYAMDPIEVNFRYGNSGQRSTMQESNNKEKITESKERGLRPLLDHIETQINQCVIWPINENFEFAFVGLDAKTQDQVADLNMKRVKTYRTVDELRAEDGLDPLKDGMGDLILDPTWLQFKNMKEQQAMQAEGGGDEEYDFEALLGGADEDDDNEDEKETPKEKEAPKKDDDNEDEKTEKSMTGQNGKRLLKFDLHL